LVCALRSRPSLYPEEHRPGELVVARSEEFARTALSRYRREQIEPLSQDLVASDRELLVARLQAPQIE
jgi:hypothetical protein